MTESLACWKCSGSLEGVVLPIGRRDECPDCGADLHVCRLCEFYDPGTSKDCREPMADEVVDKERSNFCDYFRPRRGSGDSAESGEAGAARARLEALFGGGGKSDAAGMAAEKDAPPSRPGDAAEESRRKLERLFGGEEDP